jgi:pimeloyl-ACP methyl ester carboxylesterase
MAVVLAFAPVQFWISIFIYHPTPLNRGDPRSWGLKGAVAMKVAYGDGTAITGWWQRPTQKNAPVVLLVHGRSANISSRSLVMQHLIADGMGVLMFDYRGYGASCGRPSEHNITQDTLTAYQWLLAGVDAQRIVVVGQSLGNGPAAALAAQEPVGGLLLVSPFTKLPEALAERLPWLPVHLMPWTRNRFDVEAYLVRFRGPTLLIVSKNDGLVPLENARRLQTAKPDVHWLDVSPLRHDGMLQAVAEDGRLGTGIRTLLHYNTSVYRSIKP